MIRLESRTMKQAIETAKTVRPRVRCIGDRQYAVTGRRGDVYTVKFVVVNGLKLGSCTCQERGLCYHICAAAALNIALHSTYSRPSEAPKIPAVSVPAPGVLVKRENGGMLIDNWWV
jgi:hypothetical protein